MIILKPQIIHYLENMICHIFVQMNLLKNKRQKNTNNDDEHKEETSKIKEGNESVDNSETSDNLRDDSIINTTKKEKHLFNG